MPRKKKQPETENLDFSLLTQLSNNSFYQNPIWMNQLLKDISTLASKYKRDEVLNWISNYRNHEKELNELNQFLLNSSMHFRRLADYFIEMLTFDYFLTPADTDLTVKDMKSTAYKKGYKKVLDWLERFDVKDEGKKAFRLSMEEDAVFFYKRENAGKITFQRLPSEWCKIVNRNQFGFTYAFNFMFFYRMGININDYPPEFKDYIEEVEQSKINDTTYMYWKILDPDKAVAFKFNEDTGIIKSPWMGLFLDVLEISEFKNLIKSRSALDNFLLLQQRVPMGKEDKKNNFMIDLDTAAKFQDLIAKKLPQGTTLVTSPMEITATKLDSSSASTRQSIVGVGEQAFYSSSGTSPALFGSSDNKNIGVIQSMKVDETWVFRFYRQYERWINYQINKLTKYSFKVVFPNLTHYNWKEKFETYLSAGQAGYPKSLAACALGLTPNQMLNMCSLEIAMGLQEIMPPLLSSHTQSGKEDAGRNEKPDSELSDEGLQTKNNGDNIGKVTSDD